ncbi:MAG: alpha-amylase/4-alpha-glucanotransferase domain-containing protein [Promethearchaeia archaeon]
MKEKSIYLPIVFHFHQPVDNFPWVYEDCYKQAYAPLIANLYQFPKVKVTLHFSGNLLQWFIDNKPGFIEKIKEMANRGQVELIGGGYYEPIYAVIPERDRIAQMEKLSNLIRKEFGLEVKGAWLSERVWEPNYPSFLNKVGLKYVIVDDNHFRSTGISGEDTLYTYVTEDEGNTLRIYPINEKMRYLMPWKPTGKTINYLKTIADRKGDRMALFISDAEKMGVWGSTHQFCYVKGKGHQEGDNGKPFIPAFLEQIQKNDWIKSTTLSEYMEHYSAKGMVYLPTASYDKMEEWVLPTHIRKEFENIRDEYREDQDKQEVYQFLKGGFWRYFFVKYPESNNMHKKMLHVRDKLIKIEERMEKIGNKQTRKKIKEKLHQVWEEIYKAQCNDSYWHGLFGGIYLQFLRFAVYSHLISAENMIDELNQIIYPKLSTYAFITPLDFTKNSQMDVIIESNILNLYIDLHDGGTVFELDYKPKNYNILNTLTRWKEAYHKKEMILSGKVKVDKFRKNMLRTQIIHKEVKSNDLERSQYFDYGDFGDGAFKLIHNEKKKNIAKISLEREGCVRNLNSDVRIPCNLVKRLKVQDKTISVEIEGNMETKEIGSKILERMEENLDLLIDLPFFFNGDPEKFAWIKDKNADELNYELLKPFSYKGNVFKAFDETYDLSFGVGIDKDEEFPEFIIFPLISYAYTDEGYKEIYQGINLQIRSTFTPDFNLSFCINLD